MKFQNRWVACEIALVIAAALSLPASAQQVTGVKVQPDKAPDGTSLKSIVESITRDCKTNDERAIAIYNYCLLTNYHLAYPSEPGGIPALKEIHCYGWSLCGGLHTVESALWMAAGWEHRYVGWDGHTTAEAKYDGRWHYLDIFLKFYAWEPDGKGGRTIASEDDLTQRSDELIRNAFVFDKSRNVVYAKDNQFITDGKNANWRAPAFLSCGDELDGVVSGLKTHHTGGPEAGWAGINHDTADYSTDVSLSPGMSLTNTWDAAKNHNDFFWASQQKAPAHTCPNHKDTRNDPSYGLILEPYINAEPARSYANGTIRFEPSFRTGAVLSAFASTENVQYGFGAIIPVDRSKPAFVVVKLASPYLISGWSTGEATGADKIEISTDNGKTYAPTTMDTLGAAAKGKLSALVKFSISAPLESLTLSVDVQNNPGALPYLSPGKNIVKVSVADAKSLGDNQLVVTYAYRLGSRAKSFEQLCSEGKEIAKQHGAKWSDTVTIATKTFTAKDLPGEFEIDCPTPKGEHPVYPRMLFVRREVISKKASPTPRPPGAVAAVPASPDELQTLPNPFLIGSEVPVPVKARVVKTTQIPLKYVQFSTEKGDVAQSGSLTWPKNAAEKGKVLSSAVQYAGDLKGLPPSAKIAAARVVFPVVSGHDKASERIGAVFLTSPVETGKAISATDLESVAGSVVVPQQPADASKFSPAKPFSIDVTRNVRAIAAGEGKFNGIALRIIPDRGVDDGWTVRCQVSPTEGAYLEVDRYGDE